jgi:hypothetical protein
MIRKKHTAKGASHVHRVRRDRRARVRVHAPDPRSARTLFRERLESGEWVIAEFITADYARQAAYALRQVHGLRAQVLSVPQPGYHDGNEGALFIPIDDSTSAALAQSVTDRAYAMDGGQGPVLVTGTVSRDKTLYFSNVRSMVRAYTAHGITVHLLPRE